MESGRDHGRGRGNRTEPGARKAHGYHELGVTLRNGAEVRVRAIRPDHESRLMELCYGLSPHTLPSSCRAQRRPTPRRLLVKHSVHRRCTSRMRPE